MRLKRIPIAILFLVSCAVSQVKQGQAAGQEIFLLKDDQHHQWCGYNSKSESKSEADRLNARIIVGVQYSNNRISAVHVTEGDESGDWNVDDQYSFDKDEKLQTLSRVIDNFSIGITQEELFQIQNGKAIKQSSTSRSRRTGQPTKELSGDYLPEVPIITSTTAFPFWSFVQDKRSEILSKGKACVPDKR